MVCNQHSDSAAGEQLNENLRTVRGKVRPKKSDKWNHLELFGDFLCNKNTVCEMEGSSLFLNDKM